MNEQVKLNDYVVQHKRVIEQMRIAEIQAKQFRETAIKLEGIMEYLNEEIRQQKIAIEKVIKKTEEKLDQIEK